LGAMGAALCGGVCVGLFGSFEEAVKRMVRVSRTVEPRKSLCAVYQEKYRRYVVSLESLRRAW